jgi:hypothetical protein
VRELMKDYLLWTSVAVFFLLLGAVGKRRPYLVLLLLSAPLAVVMLFASMSIVIPKESELRVVSGRVTNAEAKPPRGEDLVFRLDSFPQDLDYVHWWPRFEEVRAALQPGARVKVWLSSNNVFRTTYIHVERIDKDGQTIVSFKELASAAQGNKSIFLFFGCFLGIVTLLVLAHMWSIRERPGGRGISRPGMRRMAR